MREPEPAREDLRVFTFATPHAQAALNAVEAAAVADAATVASLRLKPVGAIVETRMVLEHLDDRAAEALADRLAACVGVHALRLEHWRTRS